MSQAGPTATPWGAHLPVRESLRVEFKSDRKPLSDAELVEADFGGPVLSAALMKSRFGKGGWGENPRGYLVLQNHRTPVLFRNLKLRVAPDSGKPGEPPATSAAPSKPTAPMKPDAPMKPGAPGQAAKPSTAEQPKKAETPKKTETPKNAETSKQTESPAKPEAAGKPTPASTPSPSTACASTTPSAWKPTACRC